MSGKAKEVKATKTWDTMTAPDAQTTACPHRLCKEERLKNGWCKRHQYVYKFMDDGGKLGYPRMDINEHLRVGDGEGNWMAYAVLYPPNETRQAQVQNALEKVRGVA